MTLHKRLVVAVALFLFTTAAFGRNLPAVDALGSGKPRANVNAEISLKAGNLVKAGSRFQADNRLGVPTFLWASDEVNLMGGPIVHGPERAEVAAARGHLQALAEVYNLSASDVTNAKPLMVLNTGRGPVIVKFNQSVSGIEIFREEINVVMTQNLDVIALTGYISSVNTPSAIPGQTSWNIGAPNAAAAAIQDASAMNIGAAQLVKSGSRDGYDYYSFTPSVTGIKLEEPVRMKRVYFHVQDGLVPAYFVEVMTSNATGEVMLDNQIDESAYMYVLSAVDGSVLFRKNMIDYAAPPQTGNLPPGGFTYRVFADPATGIPYDSPAGNGVHPKLVPLPDGAQHAFVGAQDVTLPNFPFTMNDPWLAPGATTTDGNNVDAYVNLVNAAGNADNGYGPVMSPIVDPPTGDHRAFTNATDSFLYNTVPDVDAFSANARQGSITQLFYNINFLHDWFYDSGFNEVARNGQKNNFGRGGLQSDDIKAQSMDAASFSNANMLTPADGTRPRMRMYNFPNQANTLDVQSPVGIGKLRLGISQTGLRNFDVTNDIVIATFSNSPSACTVTNAAALAGKIAMFDFDNTDGTGCAFSTRITRIHATSAAAALMVYTSGSASSVANITGINATHTKPVGVISWNSGQSIKAQLAVPTTVTARLLRVADRDGALDNQIVFHEWGHYLSNRLVSNAAGLNNNQGVSMGEGWGDFTAMLLTVRADDVATPSNATWGGVYALATYATSGVPYTGALNHGYYLGIRRTPYSTDMVNYNALTFKHISDAESLPSGPPIVVSPPNSEVHNSGEIWTTMLWECYASLLRDTQGATPRLTFQEAQDRMKQYLVFSLAMTPASPTFLEARDAVLAAAYATDLTDYLLFWQAFAKRGAGMGAIAPDRFSANHVGVVESYDAIPDLTILTPTLDDSVASCDNDGVLDSGDTGKLTIQIKNTGTSPLNATVATITSATPGVTFPSGNVVNLPASDPFETVSGSLNVSLASGLAGAQQLDFHIEVYDPTVGSNRTLDWGRRGNTNAILASTAIETVEHSVLPWTVSYNPSFTNPNPFTRTEVSPMNHVWHVDDAGTTTDQYLTSPVFTVDGSGSMNVQFDHSWSFEWDPSANYDGAVIEMSVNGGAFTDIGAPAYNGTITNYGATDTNVLKGRPGWVKDSGTIHTSLTQAIAPGSTVQVRFRFASDSAAGAPGWNIDNIAFSGVVETPFATVVADTGCAIPTATTLTPSANPSPFGASLTLTATVTSSGGTPTGNVTFYDNGNPLGTVALSSGSAQLTTSSLTIGIHTLTASYTGGAGYLPSSAPSVSETINKAASSLALNSSANPAAIGASVTFTATVSGSVGTPSGSVAFTDGITPLATVALSGGVATYTTTTLTGGSHTIHATYAGNATYASSTNSLVQVITTGSTISFDPSLYWKLESGGNVTLTVTRTGGNISGVATVDYNTADGTAEAGDRYTTSSGTVTFNANETSKTFNVPLLNNGTIEGKQTFQVLLSNANAAVLGQASATVEVMDDDTASTDFSFPLDGQNDIVWRNETTGDTKVWTFNGTTYLAESNLLQFGGNWRLLGAADFNGDGSADLLYQNASDLSAIIWYMNGTGMLSTASVVSTGDANFKLVAIGDLNGDGYPDLVWRHAVNFVTGIWLMKDNVRLSAHQLLPTVNDANWKVKGIGDFNNDGQNDILWRNTSTFQAAAWIMNTGGLTQASYSMISPSAGTPWDIVGVGDFDNDGDPDLLWQQQASPRTIAFWHMNGVTRDSYTIPPQTINNASWAIVAPR